MGRSFGSSCAVPAPNSLLLLSVWCGCLPKARMPRTAQSYLHEVVVATTGIEFHGNLVAMLRRVEPSQAESEVRKIDHC